MDHSPWVQSVLLGLHEKKIEHTLQSTPPLETLQKWGVLMPVASINGNRWIRESPKILEQLGYKTITESDIHALYQSWRGVLHRTKNPAHFFSAWSKSGDSADSFFVKSRRNFLRSLISLYMFVLISTVKIIRRTHDPDNFGDQFVYWEKKLKSSGGPFIDGAEPNTRDLMLFGVIQCHASVPVPPLQALANDGRLDQLRQWIILMHKRFKNYPYLYSSYYFEPFKQTRASASCLQRGIFYLGLLLAITMLPISILVILALVRRVPR